jgi:hypothetical protein
MKIETKFNIGDYIYFGNYGNDVYCNKGYIKDINIIFLENDYFIRYRIDTMFDILPGLITNEADRYIELDEGFIHLKPDELLKNQIINYENKINEMLKKIEELKKKLL